MRYFMDISYRGTSYNGWQTQPNGVTIQEEIEKGLTVLLKAPTSLTGSGRTDTGVHARQQVAHFDTEKRTEVTQLAYKLNALLSKDISINQIKLVTEEANARFSVTSRTYHYHLHQAKDPFKPEFSYYFQPDLNKTKINEACRIIKNWKNFECFSRVSTEVNHFNCHIFDARWEQQGTNHLFIIEANRFLRGMVRAIVGTLLDVGSGKTSLEDLKEILKSNDRSKAGSNVPSKGLYLQEVKYPTDIHLN